MIEPRDLTALILAGGRATRMGGVDKRAIVIDGATIFERQCAVLADRVAEIVVSARAPSADREHRVVLDPIADGGPLAGIAAGLAAVATPWLFVVAGDMPHLAGALVDAMRARATPACDAVGLRVGGLPEPLLALLRVATVRPVVERRLAARELKASRLLTDAGLRVAWLEDAELRQIDPTLRMLANVNAPGDV